MKLPESLRPSDLFAPRHLGPRSTDLAAMLETIGVRSLDELVGETVPQAIRMARSLELPEPVGERELLDELRAIAAQNQVYRSFIGAGYHGCITPPVILRNVLE